MEAIKREIKLFNRNKIKMRIEKLEKKKNKVILELQNHYINNISNKAILKSLPKEITRLDKKTKRLLFVYFSNYFEPKEFCDRLIKLGIIKERVDMSVVKKVPKSEYLDTARALFCKTGMVDVLKGKLGVGVEIEKNFREISKNAVDLVLNEKTEPKEWLTLSPRHTMSIREFEKELLKIII